MMVQYLLDSDLPVKIPAVAEPRSEFADAVEPVRLALGQEKRVSAQVAALTRVAREESDFQADQFMQWFLKEQVEEVALMTTLVRVSERAGADLFHLEDFIAREIGAEEADATAPKAAGGKL